MSYWLSVGMVTAYYDENARRSKLKEHWPYIEQLYFRAQNINVQYKKSLCPCILS